MVSYELRVVDVATGVDSLVAEVLGDDWASGARAC